MDNAANSTQQSHLSGKRHFVYIYVCIYVQTHTWNVGICILECCLLGTWNSVLVRPMLDVSLQEIHGQNGEESKRVRNNQKWKKMTAEARQNCLAWWRKYQGLADLFLRVEKSSVFLWGCITRIFASSQMFLSQPVITILHIKSSSAASQFPCNVKHNPSLRFGSWRMDACRSRRAI